MKKKYFIYSIILALFLTNLPVANISAQENDIFEEQLVISENNLDISEINEEPNLDIILDEENPEVEPRVLPAVPVVVAYIATAGLRAAVSKWGKSAITTFIKQQEKVARAAAKDLGYIEKNELSHGAKVYERKSGSGPKFISRDMDGHNGGAWKGATSIKNLGSKDTRSGTYDVFLTRIGD
ncbi:toxin C-terminal domain-containing protein [Lysinibacillus fusiformis]|uniref:toxin C-terminal domain-containing protein n=1 Tax=Lysinibacillus fusiformis TaxID=28031 RepID=UPI0012468F4E|nr:toxin C-terminal domain-containing protein [Lysinibacillus fusiformis]KAB0443451.1 hypothetical protein CH314_07405 [Lysinibacillus fusiformis]MBD8522122.1 hypothetical protein [Lysinibacillus fusiformis]MCT6926803.1 toxin C-terminal domain-containing protein [Lysinibacillus fusiformis]MCT6931140.1 toxin C-terminal domain-containing protein [Lysinibacillus fusiformis]